MLLHSPQLSLKYCTLRSVNLFFATPTPAKPKASGFANMNFPESFLENLSKNGWLSKTKIQEKCLPHTLKGKDLAGFAQTGTGKTGVFILTLANLLNNNKELLDSQTSCALILCPTRELAIQIEEDAKILLKSFNLKTISLFGGVNIDSQIESLKKGVHLIIATPGRLIDLYKKEEVDLKYLKLFVCDEVDRMFDMGFINDVEFILEKLPLSTQRLVFSATESGNTKELAFEYLNNPEYISIQHETPTPETIEQHALICETKNKLHILLSLLKNDCPECAIIFTNTKLTASWLEFKLKHNNLDVEMISGDLPQNKRIQLIKNIKDGKIKILIATDVASRGLHISNVSHVYNFDIPDDSANYVHRIGRTARAGKVGKSYSLICEDYGHNYEAIQKSLTKHAPKPCWYSEELPLVEDLAPNPFESSQDENKNNNHNNSNQKDSQNRIKRNDSYKNTKTRFQNTRQDTRKTKQHSSTQTRYKRNFNKHTKQTPKSFGGIVKRFLSLLIGKK